MVVPIPMDKPASLTGGGGFGIGDIIGGMSGYGDKPEEFEFMCLECVEKKEASEAKKNATKLTIKNFVKDHWKFWITLSISIIAVVIGLSRL